MSDEPTFAIALTRSQWSLVISLLTQSMEAIRAGLVEAPPEYLTYAMATIVVMRDEIERGLDRGPTS